MRWCGDLTNNKNGYKNEVNIMLEGLIGIIIMGIVIGLSRNIGTGISNTITKMGDSEDDKEKQR